MTDEFRGWKRAAWTIIVVQAVILVGIAVAAFLPNNFDAKDPASARLELEDQSDRESRMADAQANPSAWLILGSGSMLALGCAVSGLVITNVFQRRLEEGR